jgi:uncharacterized membrane protein
MNSFDRSTSVSPSRFVKMLAGALLLLTAGSIALWGQAVNAVPLSSADGRRVLIPVKDLSTDGKFFSFKTKNNGRVIIFAMLDSGKGIHVAFDACDVCYQARKGYRIVNGFAVCNNCGRRFPVTAIGTDNVTGGCWPSFLPASVAGGKVAIKTADLEGKQYLFP